MSVPAELGSAGLPGPPRPGLLNLIRQERARAPRQLVVLDDDPTGTQSVHGVPVLCDWSPETVAKGLAAGDTVFVLTNTRSLDESSAVRRLQDVVETVLDVAGGPDRVSFLTRGDSTLRGHVPAETDVLCEALATRGTPVDAILHCPAFPQAGRVTVDDVQWVRWNGTWQRADETPFASDAHFGYRSAHLPSWLEERSGGRVRATDVRSLPLRAIRDGGPDRVAAMLGELHGRTHVVANAANEGDLEVVALGVLRAEREGLRLAGRVGPAYVRARAGLDPSEPLSAKDLYPVGQLPPHGLVVVGSHVPTTTRQLEVLARLDGVHLIELDAHALADPYRVEAELSRAVAETHVALANSDVVISTSRDVLPDSAHLAVGRAISAALVSFVRQLRGHPLRYLVAKGGITGSDLATDALNVRIATVAGQMLPGLVSVWLLPSESSHQLPYVLFPGNVGEPETLARIVSRLRQTPT
jgi:uncharacterized protein YgbK (DUF1537 family)